MLVKLVELHKPEGDRVHLGEIYVSSAAVTTIRAESNPAMLAEAVWLGLNSEAKFSRITISEGGSTRTAVVIGSPSEIKTKLNKKMLLRD
jgi:hypothetical protein